MSGRTIGAIVATSNYEASFNKPYDARMLVTSCEELTIKGNWQCEGQINSFNGMIVAVADANDAAASGIYYLFDPTCSTTLNEHPNVEDIANWHKVADLNELAVLGTRLDTLEQAMSGAGLSEEEINNLITAQINGLKTEISNSGFLTAEQLADYGYITETALEGYATESYVDSAIASIPLSEYAKTTDIPDISGLATKEELPTKVSDLTNDSNFITLEQVPVVDAYTKTETDEAISKAIAEAELADKEADLTAFYTKSETDAAITAAVDAIEVPSIEGLATETYVDEKVAAIKPEAPDLTGYATEAWVEEKGYLTEHQSLDGYATETFVTGEIEKLNIPSTEGLATTEYVDTAINGIEIPDVSGFLTEIPEEYVTEAELVAKGYLTEHQDISGLATKTEVEAAVAGIEIPVVPTNISAFTNDAGYITAADVPETPDLTDYALKAEIALKADAIPYAVDKFVTIPAGNFVSGENVKGLTIAELFAKLLGLSDTAPGEEEPDSIVDSIIKNETVMYTISEDGSTMVEVPFKLNEYTGDQTTIYNPDTVSGFYQITDESGNVIESGYENFVPGNDSMFYVVALPSNMIIDENVEVWAWSGLESKWRHYTDHGLTSDLGIISAAFEENGLEVPACPEGYTLWANIDDIDTGADFRFKIIEEIEE